MARIAGVELQDNWTVNYALTKIKGIGWSSSKKIVESLKFNPRLRVSELSGEEIANIAAKLEEYPTEGDLVRQVRTNITRLQTIGSYRGIRHGRGLPVRGQRTRSNARTKRGKRKTVGAFRKEMLSKMQRSKPEKETE
ncbi:30S ribosomal protein S13 [Candidatus Woesebacteria bacterium RIFCSPLOWO2_01_FULL_39_61]|uniref:Small ribosomal subunit protein uS13 n=1 Tax=Candidatus Woesebacteria bacterium RIFCSPHIGHO2_02_FULL_39_13 TaxID=1802505 RepID=A0A1F7Z5M7_9BACT|nr:MAG: 30S ribosomal protein S13 [Candidatus Woesebacteria bacterium RIFCSPHIGHO2_01_FULL_39_95]OGM34055.1 MAG: 30S ribosomal protein S13 [Candidatus Woesebacteria bacterium RIFCSPHIGHO2_02_FULL_39_13]OGM38313.1 MAG: 30S ribosomal protein S13 [Candidatus Woesebacteria bacterium RIFCSPHIGHO2_12_FULL_40_20]OGM67776.1 MAG: 30S ribosomal protein S13 [Candidatus Woesebacteria bacterium RIFCSPLOWO2_01_FULL_39_61]OGM72725.1 MAG: 30S ribosomal protein S13 [Candidatus Woesebacteria bacterium RIFCSPLOWO